MLQPFLNGDAFLEKVKNDDAKKSFYAKVKDLTDKRTRERDGKSTKRRTSTTNGCHGQAFAMLKFWRI